MKNTSKAGIKATLIIYAALIVLLTVCTFAIPFEKISNAVLIVSYVCAVAMIIAEGSLALALFFKEENLNQKVLALPILYSGFVAMILQIVATIVFYVCNAFVNLPIWVVIIVECLLFAYFAIQLAKGFFFKERNAEYHENVANTKFMDEFRARLKAIVAINKNKNIEKVLEDLLDTAKGSDPVTNDKTLDSESELLSDLQELDEVIKAGSEEEARRIIEKTKTTLLERNALCKAGK